MNIKEQEKKLENYNFIIGLSNIGNTCFMNSSLQNLINIEPLNNFFLMNDSEYYKKSKNIDNYLGSNGEISDGYLNLLKLIKENNRTKEKYIEPIDLANKIYINNPLYDMFSQRDACEFILYFIDILHEDVNLIKKKTRINPDEIETFYNDEKDFKTRWEIYKKNNNSFLINLFYGKLKKEYFCPQHHKIKVNFQIYNMIEITNNNDKDSIEELLKNYQEEKEVNCDINCEKCGIVDNFILKTTICYLPYYFIIYLVNPIKNNNNDLEIRVSKFIEDKKENNYIYELISVISYYGNFKRGHYICKYKSSESWFIANDNNISKLSSYNIGKHDVILIFAKKQNE